MTIKITSLMLLVPLLLVACTEPAVDPAVDKVVQVSAPVTDSVLPAITLTIYKTPSCGCCKKWISHLEQNNIVSAAENYDDLTGIKKRYGIKPEHYSCHTAVSEQGFVFEGHIPARYIRQFLAESHPDALGLTVPAMPMGSPGMEVGDSFMPYDIIMLMKDGSSSVYVHVSAASQQ
ncbi:DUF411 domain-containing protein [Arsukibacterium sp.]|uniref:DUF411 domain-containing protein n=1 Tax=Arsukibacterium sp. TaxID=1977258 RepID=UPI00299D508F|nr:DUF411 domain-containing protein [Arsukibacterium sp.]MDX1537253.1 DUF411 domain-containing protein [Arsukibacterium sp.]